MLNPRRTTLLLASLALLGPAAQACAQEQKPQPSQAASVSQDIHTTRVTVTYYRPVARGRALYGNIVKWGEEWTPGANRATYVDLSADVRVEGQTLPAGSYSIWLIPRESSAWTVIFSKKWDMYHLPYPEGEEVLRLGVLPEEGSHMEALAIYFPEIEGYQATMRIHWGSTIIPVRLEAVER